MALVEAGTGQLDPTDARRYGDIGGSYRHFVEGDVLFAKITPCMENGKVAVARGLASGYGIGSTEYHVLRPREAVAPPYLLWFLLQEQFRKNARAKMTGTAGQLRVPATWLESAAIPVPPLPEQHRIVEAIEAQFSRLDSAVAALKRVQANLKRYRASVLKAACEGRLVPTEAELARNEGRDYEPASKLLERILEERRKRWNGRGKFKEATSPKAGLPAPPEGWAMAVGQQLFTWGSGKGLTQKELEDGPYSVYGGNGVTGKHSAFVSDRPTIVVGRVGALCGNVYLTNGPAWITDNAIYATTSPESLHLGFARLVFDVANLNKQAAGSGQPFVNQRMLNETAVPLPPLAEQQRIVAEVERRLSVVDELETAVAANLKRAERLRQAILKRAFEGRLVPTEHELAQAEGRTFESAEQLLARIKATREAKPGEKGKKKDPAKQPTRKKPAAIKLKRKAENTLF